MTFARRADAQQLLKLKQGKNQIFFSLNGAPAVEGKVEGSTITYPAIRPGIDLQYSAQSEGVRELLVLSERPATADDVTFRFRMDAPGLQPRTTPQGGIELVDLQGGSVRGPRGHGLGLRAVPRFSGQPR